MQAMGGRVWIEANGFGGSRFVVALPEASAARL
jgi:signal transduction histidine kinase